MRKTIAILCLVIVIFGGLLAVITYQLRRALRMSDETFDADDEDHDAISHQSRNTRHSNGRNGRNMGDIEHRELTEREIQMISSRR